MQNYALMYRLGLTPWERYGKAAWGSVAAMLDREESERPRPLGRALDLGCGRGQYTPELARRGWQATGIDVVPAAVEAARRKGPEDVSYVVGDVTGLPAAGLGTFDLFLDIGCFQGLGSEQRSAMGRGVSELAAPRAGLLMLAFGVTRLRGWVGGVSQDEVEAAFAGWELLSVDPAPTDGLGWPMNRTSPRWYRLRRHGMSVELR
jgi:SAM-dependent methyltransferase